MDSGTVNEVAGEVAGVLNDKRSEQTDKFIEIVRKAIDALEKQGCQCIDGSTLTCQYRTEDGNRSIVGHMIGDDALAHSLDAQGFVFNEALLSSGALNQAEKALGISLSHPMIELLAYLQECHDYVDVRVGASYRWYSIIFSGTDWNLATRITAMRKGLEMYECSLE